MKTFKKFVRETDPPYLDGIFLVKDENSFEMLYEGKWLNGRFDRSIRIDRETHHQSGDEHAHIYGRKGNAIGVVNLDGTKSHGGEFFRISDEDAEVLKAKGFTIPKGNIVEWIVRDTMPALLLD